MKRSLMNLTKAYNLIIANAAIDEAVDILLNEAAESNFREAWHYQIRRSRLVVGLNFVDCNPRFQGMYNLNTMFTNWMLTPLCMGTLLEDWLPLFDIKSTTCGTMLAFVLGLSQDGITINEFTGPCTNINNFHLIILHSQTLTTLILFPAIQSIQRGHRVTGQGPDF
ncbi:hypothetical protein ACJX0J_012285 [Zea mays]